LTRRFVDSVVIVATAGKGGEGIVSFHREPYVPKGGPDGGDGGRGGDIVVRADARLSTLADIRNNAVIRAENGKSGGPSNRTGRNGKDTVLTVPPGTDVYDQETGEVVGELLQDDQVLVAARGGAGGKGNASFKTSTRRAPRKATPGGPGQHRRLRLELRLLADVGMVGFPNAGKSTLLGRISAAHPKTASYPFTTLHPALGVVELGRGRSFVVADLPGLIEGAAEGRGMGHDFLRHAERSRIVVFLLAPDLELPPSRQLAVLRGEMESYGIDLDGMAQVVALAKCDLLEENRAEELTSSIPTEVSVLSSLTGRGVESFVKRLARLLSSLSERTKELP
jgi:GTP-binding protein